MGLYTHIASGLVFPLHELLKGHSSYQKKRQLEQSQWLPPAKLHALQQRALVGFLQKLYRQNTYYKNLFQQLSIGYDDLSTPNILQKLPILNKDTIRANYDDLVTGDHHGLKVMSTSGSSGSPLKFALGKNRISHDVAAKWRATRWWGVDIGDKEAVIWGSNIELSAQGMLKAVRDKVMRSRLFAAQHLDSAGRCRLIEDLLDYQPAMIYAYPSILCLLADTAHEHEIDLRWPELKVIFCTAEKLYPHQREKIETAFAVPVADGYGSRDAGFIAHQCAQGQLHICSEDIVTEILDEQGLPCQPGEIGNLVVTNLCADEFPMVRYQTGDLAMYEDQPCSCGRGLPAFREVIGRSNDVLLATDGSSVHGAYIGNVIREDEAVCHFQLTQENAVDFTLKIVNYPEKRADIGLLRSKLEAVLGNKANVICEEVEQIAAERTGKYKYIINRYQGNA